MTEVTPTYRQILDYVVRWLIRILVVVTLAILIVPAVYTPTTRAGKRLRSSIEISNLRGALAAYREIHGKYPEGTPSQVVGTLRSEKIRSDPLLPVAPDRLNAAGEYLDLWGTPYRIFFDESGQPHAYSFGPNRQDDQGRNGSDDITSDDPALVRRTNP